jgi:hypothetical protein
MSKAVRNHTRTATIRTEAHVCRDIRLFELAWNALRRIVSFAIEMGQVKYSRKARPLR